MRFEQVETRIDKFEISSCVPETCVSFTPLAAAIIMIRPITIFAVVIYAALFAIRNGSLAQAAVMSIDYGTEWFKVGLIKPGIPLDVALNKDSKRKTQAVVTIRDNERMYGSDAVALVSPICLSVFLSVNHTDTA